MKAGILTETLTFKELKETTSETGYVTPTYILVFQQKAYKKKLTQDDVTDAKEIFNRSTIQFLSRYNPQVNDKMRVEYEGNDYNITSIDRNRADNSMIITLKKINACCNFNLLIMTRYTPLTIAWKTWRKTRL